MDSTLWMRAFRTSVGDIVYIVLLVLPKDNSQYYIKCHKANDISQYLVQLPMDSVLYHM